MSVYEMPRTDEVREACGADRGDEGGAERTDVKERVLWACAAAAALLMAKYETERKRANEGS